MAKTTYAGADLSHRDLRGVDFSGETLYGTDLRGSKLHGSVISLDCATFHGVKLDARQVATFLLLLSQTDVGRDVRGVLESAAESVSPDAKRMKSVMRITNG